MIGITILYIIAALVIGTVYLGSFVAALIFLRQQDYEHGLPLFTLGIILTIVLGAGLMALLHI